MLQISNNTPFNADLTVFPDEEGIDTVIAVLKATFDVLPDAGIRVAKNQMPVVKNDEYWGIASGNGLNILGELWGEIRMNLLK